MVSMEAIMTDSDYNLEGAAKHGNLCRVAIGFAIACDSDTEALYAYLNARWAARLALAAEGNLGAFSPLAI